MKVRLIRKSSLSDLPKEGEIGELFKESVDFEGDARVHVAFPSLGGNIMTLYKSQVEYLPERAKVILFKESGKYYTCAEWKIPTVEEILERGGNWGDSIGPFCMKYSEDFRRVGGKGAVLVETQEPWGYPHLFPGE